jgi:hypothetical protein
MLPNNGLVNQYLYFMVLIELNQLIVFTVFELSRLCI